CRRPCGRSPAAAPRGRGSGPASGCDQPPPPPPRAAPPPPVPRKPPPPAPPAPKRPPPPPLVVVVGTVLDTVATTTWSPGLTPERIWVRSGSEAPTWTVRVSGAPLTMTCTVEPRTALVGTVSTCTTWLTMTLIDAEAPACSAGWLPSSVTVTVKVATPEVTVASGAIEVTLPVTASVDPAGSTLARWPTAISPTWASVTVPLTVNMPGVSRTMACVPELDEDADEDPP